MNKVYISAMSNLVIQDEKQETLISNLIQYRNAVRNGAKKKFFSRKWPRVFIAAAAAIPVLFCAIFFPVMAMTGSNNNVSVAEHKAQLTAAIGNLKTVESYVETIEITSTASGISVASNYTTSYLKTESGYIAEGLMETGSTSQKYYAVNEYLYMPVSVPAEFGGIKTRLDDNFVSIAQFFAQNAGFLTPEIISGLNDKSEVKTKTINGQTVYSFKTYSTIGIYPVTSDFTVSVDSNSRITEIKQNSTISAGGQTMTAVMVAAYEYIPVEVNLPNDLDTYMEYAG